RAQAGVSAVTTSRAAVMGNASAKVSSRGTSLMASKARTWGFSARHPADTRHPVKVRTPPAGGEPAPPFFLAASGAVSKGGRESCPLRLPTPFGNSSLDRDRVLDVGR